MFIEEILCNRERFRSGKVHTRAIWTELFDRIPNSTKIGIGKQGASKIVPDTILFAGISPKGDATTKQLFNIYGVDGIETITDEGIECSAG